MPWRPGRFKPLVHALVADIAGGGLLVAVQERSSHVRVVDGGRSTCQGVRQARLRVHADVGPHAEVPVVALLRLVISGLFCRLPLGFPLPTLEASRRQKVALPNVNVVSTGAALEDGAAAQGLPNR